jgi:hypothetical protein
MGKCRVGIKSGIKSGKKMGKKWDMGYKDVELI